MTGWLIYDKSQYDKNKWFAEKLMSECSQFSDIRLIITENLQFGVCSGKYLYKYNGEPLAPADFAISRTIFPFLSCFLEQSGTRVFNGSTVSELCNDKRATYTAAARLGVPIMRTEFYDRKFFNVDFLKNAEYPIIIKSAGGHGGNEVFYVPDFNEAKKCISLIRSDDFLAQEICPTVGKDLRVYVLAGKIIGCVLRSSDTFKSNYSLGGKAEPYSADSNVKNAVEKILTVFEKTPDFIGIDFLIDKDRLIFNEIEDVVGTRTLYKTSDTDPARLFAEHIRAELNS